MKSIRYIQSTLIALMVLATTSCADDILPLGGGEEMVVTFRPTISNTMTRSIGDGTKINELVVGVYSGESSEKLELIFTQEMEWNVAKEDGVNLTLIEGRTYNILFWAHHRDNSGNSAYEVTDNGIKVDYDDYLNGGFAKMEELDAFCATATVKVGSQKIDKGDIPLSRPLAQVNFADDTTSPTQGSHKAVVTFTNVPTEFNPFEGKVTKSEATCTFTFTDFPTEPLKVDGTEYHYVTDNYFFAPASIGATLDLQNADGSIKTVELADGAIALEANKKTNVLGSIVQKPETWSVWDGETTTEPEFKNNNYIIDEASDIAWLAEYGATLKASKTFLQTKDIDMASKAITSIKLPAESTYDGGGKTIKNFANSLFGDATSITVKDLTLEKITASSASSHVGVLVNTLKGSSKFTDVSIANSSATTSSGAAGGMIGYIVRTTEQNRSETLDVSFTCCKLDNVSVSGSASEGKFVGLLSGYDNNEALSFDSECKATEVSVSDYTSVYTKANNSACVNGDVTNKYDGWLGHETYRRAKVSFGGVRLAPRWDGKTATAKDDLLLYNGESNKYEVHSPFDLAGVRNATDSPAALYLMENVDMHGQGADGEYNVPSNWTQSDNASNDDNYFMSFSTIGYLDGGNYGIYNLSIDTQEVSTSLYYGGFIQGSSGTTTHKNIKFYYSCVVVPLVVYKNEDKGSAGMLISNIAGDSYTMENVHTYRCKIFALQKVGGLAARVAATKSTIKNCSVNYGYIENYECKEHLEEFGGGLAKFYSYGEVGGLLGFVQDGTTISSCNVKNTTIYAYGQSDQLVGVVPGRHVSLMIGDIRTYNGGAVTISSCSVDSNTKCTKRHDQHEYGGFFGIGAKKVKEIGKCYYVATDDKKGKVVFNGTTIFS